MMKFRENEEAVSPVIGVILMVAITVILAAVIAAFVFGMSPNVGATKTVAVTASLNSSQYLIVTLQGGGDVADLEWLNMTIDGTPNLNVSSKGAGTTFNSTAPITRGQHVVIVAYFNDGAEQVVLDKNY